MTEKTMSLRYVVQVHYLSGPIGKEKWIWTDYHRPTEFDNIDEAKEHFSGIVKKIQSDSIGNRFLDGKARIIERIVRIEETVIEESGNE